MRKIYFHLMLLVSSCLSAQDQHCATDVVMKRVYDRNPALKIKKQQQDEARRNSVNKAASASATYIIPIVFHVLHTDGPENISDAQVLDALRILNRDFAKQNPDTTDIIPAFKNLADSTKIQFVLAKKDPVGNCTNGIVHHYDTDTDWDENSMSLFSHTWDPTKYLNIHIVRTITLNGGFGAAGYTYLPGTWPAGDQFDAVVVLNNYFGSIGTGSAFLSRVLTHEVGHWLDLNHVFGGSNNAGVDCTGDDFITDTPPTPGYLNCPNPAIPSQYQVCTPGVSENFQNYMDYSYCCRMFTQEQGLHMQQALQSAVSGRNNLWSNANLIATGVIPPANPCSPIADFKYSRSKVCTNTPVYFTDASWNGTPTSYTWSFPGGTPATSSFSSETVTYPYPGTYSVTYSVSGTGGISLPVTKSNIITVTSALAQYNNFWTEGFENLPALNNEWTIVTSSGAAKWIQTNDASYTGGFSAKIPPENNTRKTVTSMISPAINFGGVNLPHITFRLATADATPNHINTLNVYYSVDCGTNWQKIYSKTGQSLVTSASSTPNFIPQKSEWRLEAASLQSIIIPYYTNFKFEYIRDTIPGSSNIFIDDINISGPVGVNETPSEINEMEIFPVPSKGSVEVSFHLASTQKVKFCLYDVSGRAVDSAVKYELEAGEHKYQVNSGRQLLPGVYVLNIEVGKFQCNRKIIISE